VLARLSRTWLVPLWLIDQFNGDIYY
jgi:hypothetical protein